MNSLCKPKLLSILKRISKRSKTRLEFTKISLVLWSPKELKSIKKIKNSLKKNHTLMSPN
jgi:hypothetical protein